MLKKCIPYFEPSIHFFDFIHVNKQYTTGENAKDMKSDSQAKTTLFRRNFQTFNARAARAALSANLHFKI